MPSSACKKQTCALDRKSTRLNSSHTIISYAVFCSKKKKPGRWTTAPPPRPAPTPPRHPLAPPPSDPHLWDADEREAGHPRLRQHGVFFLMIGRPPTQPRAPPPRPSR